MFRVEVERFLPADSPTPADVEPCTPFFISMCTGPLKIGRTLGQITFPKDKSVSRSHCEIRVDSRKRLRLDSAAEQGVDLGNGVSQQFLSVASQAIDDSNKNNFLFSQAPVASQVEASQLSQAEITPVQNDAVLVIDTRSSKFGTYCFVEMNDLNPQGRYSKLPQRESVVLNLDASDSGLIRVGAQAENDLETASLIRITKLDFNICLSVTDKTLKKAVEKNLENVGANVSKTWDSRWNTHLVTEKKKSTAKNICAWGSNRPIVTPEYVLAFSERKSPEAPIPSEHDYNPPGDEISKEKPNQSLFEQFRFVCFGNDDNVEICRVGGCAGILDLKTVIWDDELKFLDAFEENCGGSEVITVLLDLLTKKDEIARFKKQTKLLLDRGIPVTGKKNIAVALVQNKLLTGVDGETLKVLNTSTRRSPTKNQSPSKRKQSEANVDDGSSTEEEPESVREPLTKKQRKIIEPSPEKDRSQGRGKPSHDADADADVDADADADANADADADANAEAGADANGEVVANNLEAAHESGLSPEDTPKMKLSREKNLPKAKKNGWLKAAPLERSAYKIKVVGCDGKFAEEIAGVDEEIDSVYVNGMIRALTEEEKFAQKKVVRGGTKKKGEGKGGNNRSSLPRKKVNDFKRFRKNKCLRSSSSSSVPLYSTLPKESARELNLIKKQRELDKQQEAAEELFNFAGGKTKNSRNRIDNYLTGTQTSKKRSR